MTEMPEPTRYGEAIWLEPFPDVLLEGIPDQAPGPEARYEAKEALELGFIVGLQHLPPQQRAVLVLRDVLGYHAEEVAEMLETTPHSVNSLLRRARAAFESRLPAAGRERAPLPNSKRERDTVGRFADAIQTGDIDGVVALLIDDAWLTMPPEPYEYQGPAAIGAFLGDRTIRRGAPVLVPTRANTQPAFGVYFPTSQTEIARPYAMLVLTLEGEQISAITWFGGNSVFPHFGLPRILRWGGVRRAGLPPTHRGTRRHQRRRFPDRPGSLKPRNDRGVWPRIAATPMAVLSSARRQVVAGAFDDMCGYRVRPPATQASYSLAALALRMSVAR